MNLHFLLDTLNTCSEKKKKNCGKMTSLPFPVALICAMFVSRNDGMKRQNGWSCDLKKKKKKEIMWLTLTGLFHLVSSGSRHRKAESLPSLIGLPVDMYSMNKASGA